MNQEVWKFDTTDKGFVEKFEIKMPKNAQLLNVDIDANNSPCIWALVYPQEEMEIRHFELFGIGQELHNQELHNDMGIERKYVGSYSYGNVNFIGHIFERIN